MYTFISITHTLSHEMVNHFNDVDVGHQLAVGNILSCYLRQLAGMSCGKHLEWVQRVKFTQQFNKI